MRIAADKMIPPTAIACCVATDTSFFISIVRHGSISAAARALGLSPPALSKRLAQLEERLGVHLLHRNTRAMNLTDEGQLYYERASQLFADFDALEQDVMNRRSEPSGVLRVNAPLNFGRVRVAPMISAFSQAYPKLEVDLILSDHPYNLIEGGFDAGIRFGAMPDSGMRARRIATNRRHLWASPSYLKNSSISPSPTYPTWTVSDRPNAGRPICPLPRKSAPKPIGINDPCWRGLSLMHCQV